MSSFKDQIINSLKLSLEDIRLLKSIGEYKGKQDLFKQQTPEILKSLTELARIESSESSNRIEGISAPHKRIKAIVNHNSEPRDRSEQEIAGYRDALNLIHESAKHMAISNNVILQVHTMLYRYLTTPGGVWKSVDNQITEKDSKGNVTIRFKTVSPFDTPRAMEELILNYQQKTLVNQVEPLITIPLFIFDFLCIHPFLDGNGRTSRLITLLLLYQNDYEVGRYISLERIIEESKETYYESLQASSNNWHTSDHDIMPWLRYFWGIMIRAYKEFEERVGTLDFSGGSKTMHVRKTILKRLTPFSVSDLENDCPQISRETIRNVLRTLKSEGLIKSTGKGRSAKWILINNK